jgi:putative tributyrin esterase
MSKYRNVELSDPLYEESYLRFLTFKSAALKRRGDVTLFIPPGIETAQTVPLVLLLHGVYGSHWAWAYKGGAHKTALSLQQKQLIRPMILAMPSDGSWGDGSGYIPQLSANYESWIVEDVVGCVTECVPELNIRSPLFISGLSMGGYGALRLGARYSTKFQGISAHSSVTTPGELLTFIEEPLEIDSSEEYEIMYWIKRHRSSLPPIRFDCGRNDRLIESNRHLHKQLQSEQILHSYFEYEGDHSWNYWRTHLADTLLFFEQIMKSSASSTNSR